ncbi:MAG: alpha/beta hydrolase, partial [Desulfamplus sp.]|nr:alpha/beta hydrolase [Desulfamplus sp.]
YMGYHVLSLDWRGQGLSVRALPDLDKGYVRDFQHYLNDLELFYNLYIVPLKQPVTIIAHSMGGHITLRFLGQYYNHKNIKKAILISPMLDIVTSPVTGAFASRIAGWGARRLADLAVMAGLGAAYIPGGTDYCKEAVEFKDNLLTHDMDNFWLEHREIENNRSLALGGVTWWWLKAAFDSIDMLKKEKFLSQVKIPVSICSAAQDRVVCNETQKRTCQHLPDGHFVSIPGARHEILFETDDIRILLWHYISTLLQN